MRRTFPAAILARDFVVLVALGVWQLQRRDEKLRLIARVEGRLAAPPVAPPGPARWNAIGPAQEYTRVRAEGRYRAGSDTLVQAVTALGGGYWVLTPLDTSNGFTLLVNRGFVSPAQRDAIPLPRGRVTVRGLLRLSEPDGAFLQRNDPAADRWFSRDVGAIAARDGPGPTAPYFIDAAAGPPLPVGGLTVIRFANNHLPYALTWFALAALVAAFAVHLCRRPNA